MKQNQLIRASAGTGKTFSLATRFICLMVFQDVAPERILALTFSRAAAQEIYMKLLERLWKAAGSEEDARSERQNLVNAFPGSEREQIAERLSVWSSARFASLLRKVVFAQHYGSIATIDSFILRVVRSFPLEMGFQHAVEVLDDFGEHRALVEARAALLETTRAPEGFERFFWRAVGGNFPRTCSRVLAEALEGWRTFLQAHKENRRPVTAASMRKALGIAERPQLPDLSALPQEGRDASVCCKFIELVRGFAPGQLIFPDRVYGKMARYFAEHPEATEYTYTTDSGKEKRIACGTAGAAAIRAGLRYMFDVKYGQKLEEVEAKLYLCRLVEEQYAAATRRRGLLTFSDFTECQAVAEADSEKALRLENLQFRFDSRFDHWALDEFQDTSRVQWMCLRRLVREAAQAGGGRTVMVVGDLKQSIYAWRGGDDGPFKEMMGWPEFSGETGEIVPNDVSYRYGKNTADFINRVFGPENIRSGGVLGTACEPAIERWLAEDCWMRHRAYERDGKPRADDFVEVIEVQADGREEGTERADEDVSDGAGAAMRVLAPKVCDLVVNLWRAHEAVGSTDTVGILVRNNHDGVALAECLRMRRDIELPVVWEGADGVLDSPVVHAVLALLRLAEHPQDTFAWETVNRLLPVRRFVFPELSRQGGVAAAVSRMLSRSGLARTLKEIVWRLRAASDALDIRTVSRLETLVREAVAYELRRNASADLDDFVEYLKAVAGRETSTSPHVIRILTIHRSKGLTLDHVIVPILEKGKNDSIVKPRAQTPLTGEGWALTSVSEAEACLNHVVKSAWDHAANERVIEQLRLNYVALTRARKSTHVFVCGDAHEGRVQFRDVLCRPFGRMEMAGQPVECAYGRLVCSFGVQPRFGVREKEPVADAVWEHASGRGRVERRTPSVGIAWRGGGRRESAETLFASGRTAAERGLEAHACYAAIEWIDPAAPKDETEARILASEWRSAFVKPAAVATLWRERAYESFEGGIWETGRIDRVVFTGTGAGRSAVIYDFKTGEAQEGKSVVRERHAAQLVMYRRALAKMTGIPVARIGLVVLLEATGEAVDIGGPGVSAAG